MTYSDWLGMPPDWSASGGPIDSLIFWIHVLMVALFVGWGGFFCYVLVRFRKGANAKADYAGVKSHASSYLEVAVAVIEVLLLVGIAIPVWADRLDTGESLAQSPESLKCRVVAQQFAWNVHYPGPDGKYGPTAAANISGINPVGLDFAHPDARDDVVSVNNMHVVKDRPVALELSSLDVIHSFFVPNLRIKQDAIPGNRARMSFTSLVEGETHIACAQLCGVQHSVMKGLMTIESQEAFDAWLESVWRSSNPNGLEPNAQFRAAE